MTTPLILSADDQAFIDTVKTDARLVTSDGISVDTDGDGAGDTPYAITGAPTKNFNSLCPPGSGINTKLEDGLRVAITPLARQLRPLRLHAESVGPSFAFTTTATDLLTVAFPAGSKPAVARTVTAVVNFTAYSTSTNTSVEYWVDVDGVESTRMRYFFTEANAHRNLGATWLVPLAVGATTVKLRAVRRSGSGTITLDAEDCATITLWG